MKFADDGDVRAAQYAHDLALGATVPFNTPNARHHAIAVHSA